MPTYVYHCSACGSEFEIFQRITEDALTSCPHGHEGTVKRVIQPVAVAFKGEGFHINDYAPKGGGASDAPVKAEEAKPAEAKPTETKPDAAPAASTTKSEP